MNTDEHRFGFSVRFALLFCAIALLCAGCRHVEPVSERRSSSTEIQQHVAGNWLIDEKTDYPGIQAMMLKSDGTFVYVLANSRKRLTGTWECQQTMLLIKIADQPGSVAEPMRNEVDLYPVIYADERELVLAAGISATGRIRFKRQ